MKTLASTPGLFVRLGAPISVIVAAILALVLVACALLASWIAPYDPTDLASFELINAELPPAFTADGDPRFLLGTDNQGRDLLSAMLYGARVSIAIGGGAVLLAATLGVTLGLLAGYFGGRVDALIMRIADVILSFPTILLALAGERHRAGDLSRSGNGGMGADHPDLRHRHP